MLLTCGFAVRLLTVWTVIYVDIWSIIFIHPNAAERTSVQHFTNKKIIQIHISLRSNDPAPSSAPPTFTLPSVLTLTNHLSDIYLRVRRGEAVDGYKCREENSVMHSESDQEPMEVLMDGGDVVWEGVLVKM